MIAKSILQKSAPPDKANQNALISAIGTFPAKGAPLIGSMAAAHTFAQNEGHIGDLQNQITNLRKRSLTVDEIVDSLNDGLHNGLKGSQQNWDFVKYVFNPRSHEELKKSLQRPGKETLSRKILPIIQPPS
jgi:hypothetical protein